MSNELEIKNNEPEFEIRSDAPPNTMVFRLSSESVCGTLSLNDEGKMQFDGDVDASAQILFDYVCTFFNRETNE